jgi:hypothetical protein
MVLAIAHESWIKYMDNPSKGLTGAVGRNPVSSISQENLGLTGI